jgi:hypothetical protein
MKLIHCTAFVLALTVMLTGCKNRLETYEPYSTFDERMAAANSHHPAPESVYQDQYASVVGDEFADPDKPNLAASSPVKSNLNKSSGVEVPFESSRGGKHAANIGAL